MKKIICFILCTIMLFTVAACGTEKSENSAEQQTAAPSEAEQASFEWTREGYFQDENENMLSVTWMEDIDEPGWYVGCMLGEDSWGGTLPQEGSTLHGALPSSGSKDDITVTVSEEGEDGLLLVVEGGETYHFTSMGDMTASIIVTIGTEGFGMIGRARPCRSLTPSGPISPRRSIWAILRPIPLPPRLRQAACS